MTTVALLLAVLTWIAAGAITLLKRKWGSLAVGLFFVPVWIVGRCGLPGPTHGGRAASTRSSGASGRAGEKAVVDTAGLLSPRSPHPCSSSPGSSGS